MTLVTATFAFLRRGPAAAVVLAVLLAAILAVRGLVRADAWSAVVATLYRRLVGSLLTRDLFAAAPFEKDDGEAATFEAVDAYARIAVDLKPTVAADAAAAVVVALVFALTQPASTLLIGVAGLVAASGVVALSRASTTAEAEREWSAYRPVVDRLVAALAARFEIVANGATRRFEDGLQTDLDAWTRASLRSERMLGLVGRAPVIFGGAIVVGSFVLARAFHDGVTFDVVSDAAIFGSALPPFASVARNIHEMRKLAGRAALLDPWLAGAFASTAADERDARIDKVEWRGVSFRYPHARSLALTSVEASCERGQALIVTGPNGSGKSTLLKTLVVCDQVEAGTVLVDGRAIGENDARRASIAYLPQRPFIADRATVRDSFLLVSAADDGERKRWLEAFGLWNVLERKHPDDPLAVRAAALSAGERQRLALARCLSSERGVLLLDEPDANLDAAGIELLKNVLVAEVARGKLVIVAAHTPELVELGGSVIALNQGRLLGEARADASAV